MQYIHKPIYRIISTKNGLLSSNRKLQSRTPFENAWFGTVLYLTQLQFIFLTMKLEGRKLPER